MAVLIRQLSTWYKFINEDAADPRTQNYFLMSSLCYPLILIGIYLYLVFNVGPKFMEKRQPYKLHRLMQLYNIVQIVWSMYMFYEALNLGWLHNYNIFCQPMDLSNSPIAVKITRVVWYYFLLKLLDLMDTFFFILRKKQNQVSFLHVYHHAGMVLGSWCGTKYLPGGHVTFLGLVNSFVHTIMYTYYLLSSMKINTKSWKKHITQLQLLQFALILLHFSQLFWEDCGFPMWPAIVMVPQNVFMIVLFGEFYYNTYIKKKPTSKVAPRKIETNGVSAEIPNGQVERTINITSRTRT